MILSVGVFYVPCESSDIVTNNTAFYELHRFSIIIVDILSFSSFVCGRRCFFCESCLVKLNHCFARRLPFPVSYSPDR